MKPFTQTFSLMTLIILTVTAAHADFVSNANRIDTDGFPSFFMTRIDQWLVATSPARARLLPNEAAFIAKFDSTLDRFASKMPQGLVRTVDIQPAGPFRFLDLQDRNDVRALTLEVLHKRAPKFLIPSLKDKKIGLGLAPKDGADIELLIWDDQLSRSPFVIASKIKVPGESGEVIVHLKNSSVIGVDLIEIATKTKDRCPPVVVASQVDTIHSDTGQTSYVYHVQQFQDLALDPGTHALYDKGWEGLNINPGFITWDLKTKYSLSYP